MRRPAVLLLACLAWGCGNKAAPIVPLPKVPAPAAALWVEVECETVVLSFQPPDRNANGAALTDLAGFVIERRRGPLGGERPTLFRDPEVTTTPTVTPTPRPSGAPTPEPPWVPEPRFV